MIGTTLCNAILSGSCIRDALYLFLSTELLFGYFICLPFMVALASSIIRTIQQHTINCLRPKGISALAVQRQRGNIQ